MGEEHRMRTIKYSIFLFPEEKAMLTKNAYEYGLSKADYLRKLILAEAITGHHWYMEKEQAKELIHAVNMIGNNINQIAYNTNVHRFASNADWADLKSKYFDLLVLFCEFAKRETGNEELWYEKVSILSPKD